MVKPWVLVVGLGLALPAGAGAVLAQPTQPDFSVLATTPGTVADRAAAGPRAAGTARTRRLHLEGLGVGYDVDDRVTLKGGFRPGGRSDEAGSGSGGSSGVYLGVRRSLGRP
ncbi:hypothetical protein [Rhodoplanes azumiensis]|uniref:Outer membrane protein beta-barrel domain-containing protein n=1 Tax=Rhodoplanes azumiensis TaxID=1897628 RepID=A0ABW5AR95_9BRAD